MKLDPSFIWTAFVQIRSGIPKTLFIMCGSESAGWIIGSAGELIRIYKVPFLHPLATGYVTFIRGTPMLTHLLLIYFGLPMIIDGLAAHFGWGFRSVSIPMIGFAYITFSITAGAYMSEVVRSGLLAVDRGQMEAA
ncbi:cysteine ABC transporter permease, partial [Paenibacillus riograndensis]